MVRRAAFPPRAPYLVAAIDDAHGGRVATARRLVGLAVDAGVDAVKFSFDSAPGARRFPAAAWREIRRETGRRVAFVAAPHDVEALDAARRLRPDVYQVDPPALDDSDLIRRIARERRPVLVVAGACTTATVRSAIRALHRCPQVILHTVASPALPPASARLQFLPWLAARFRKPVGYLGAEPGIGWALVAVCLGAVVVEKQMTLDRALSGGMHAGAIEPLELGALAAGLRDLTLALRPVGDRRVLGEEMRSLEREARSLVARRPLGRGRRLTASDVESRPASGGLSPRLAGWLEGRRLRYDVEAGEPITFGVVDVE